MIVCRDLSQHYGLGFVIDRFSGSFRDRGLYLLLGESGSGKTTFLNLLAGFVPFSEGTVRWDGKTYKGRVTHEDPASFDYITQDPVFVDHLSVTDNLRILGGGKKILTLLRRFGLEERKNAFPPTLSGGERQRLAIIRSLLKGKKVLLLDEPTAALDPANKRAVFETLAALKNEVLIICATHDQAAVEYADAIVHFSRRTRHRGWRKRRRSLRRMRLHPRSYSPKMTFQTRCRSLPNGSSLPAGKSVQRGCFCCF